LSSQYWLLSGLASPLLDFAALWTIGLWIGFESAAPTKPLALHNTIVLAMHKISRMTKT
jgi:hypothetical protein